MHRKILVTGGAGFIGSNFVHHVLKKYPDVFLFNMDVLTYAGNRENLRGITDPSRHILIESDICDQARIERLLREQDICTIINFAAETHVDRSIMGASPFIWTNIQGTYSLLEAARTVWLEEQQLGEGDCCFLQVSTDEVYGTLEPDDPPFSETTPYAPNSPYSASKASGDFLVRAYHQTYGLPTLITHCSNNYGPFQYPEKLIPLMILNAVEGKPLPIYGDGRQIRDWLFVEDHVRALWMVLEKAQPGSVYTIGAEVQPTNLEIVDSVCALLDERFPDSEYVPFNSLKQSVTDRKGHDRRYAIDSSRIRKELGWAPEVSLKDGLASTVDWYLAHRDWVNQVRSRDTYNAWMKKNYQNRENSA
ncbi:MAG: dTDP-glucose 4,6-dehydratase [Anaerolineales bacterium]|nr:dTDP-glucose 4,6-dehydratase [Anaerolineales bacterium]